MADEKRGGKLRKGSSNRTVDIKYNKGVSNETGRLYRISVVHRDTNKLGEENMKLAYADVPEGQIHYRTEGSGEPVLLLHMAVSSSDEYTRVIPFLSKAYRAIAMDFLGYGDSDEAPRQYQIPDHARTVVGFMDSLGIDKASVVGHHAGAQVGVELAASWPERVEKLVLSSCPYWRDENERMASAKEPVFSQVKINLDGWHLMEWWRRAKRYGDPVEIVAERAVDMHKAGIRGEELHWAAHAYDTKLKLPLIKCPTLVLSGTRDRFCPLVQDVKNLIPRSKITIIQNGPVYIDRVMPKEFAGAILTFLENPGV